MSNDHSSLGIEVQGQCSSCQANAVDPTLIEQFLVELNNLSRQSRQQTIVPKKKRRKNQKSNWTKYPVS